MFLSNPLIVIAVLCALLSLLFFILTITSFKKKKLFRTSLNFVIALLMFSLTALFSAITIAIQGYQALTREELAATVQVEPTGEQKFTARFAMPDHSEKTFLLAGDQLLYRCPHSQMETPRKHIRASHFL